MWQISESDATGIATASLVGFILLAVAAAVLLRGWRWKAVVGIGFAVLALVVFVERRSYEGCLSTNRGCSECLCDFFFLSAYPG
jgi:hypothetical protein